MLFLFGLFSLYYILILLISIKKINFFLYSKRREKNPSNQKNRIFGAQGKLCFHGFFSAHHERKERKNLLLFYFSSIFLNSLYEIFLGFNTFSLLLLLFLCFLSKFFSSRKALSIYISFKTLPTITDPSC